MFIISILLYFCLSGNTSLWEEFRILSEFINGGSGRKAFFDVTLFLHNKIGYFHKVTNHDKKHFKKKFEKIPYTYKAKRKQILPDGSHIFVDVVMDATKNGNYLGLEYVGKDDYKLQKGYGRYIAQESDFEHRIISGTVFHYSSKNDPKYIKVMKESEKRNRISRNKKKHIQMEKEMDMLRIALDKHKEREKLEREKDRIKILAHGFDPLTSFRSEKQISMDLINLNK